MFKNPLHFRTNVSEIENVEGLYDDLMNLIVRLGNCGVIHGDFNEFNIMLTDDQKPILIDFPQMVSTSHPNAQMYFDRDVQGVREIFRKRYGYESEEYPKFEDLEREDSLDNEVKCSGYGFTQEMEDDLLKEYGVVAGANRDEEEEEEFTDSDSEDFDFEQENDSLPAYTETELSEFRQKIDKEVTSFEKKGTNKNVGVLKYIEEMSKQLEENVQFEKPLAPEEEIDIFEDSLDKPVPAAEIQTTSVPNATPLADPSNDDAHSISSNDLETTEQNDELSKLDPNSREYRFKMVRKLLDDAKSMRSYSTSASTIAPSVVSDRVKRGLTEREKRETRRKCVPKGEASAVRRMRKDNAGVVREYAGWDF